MCGISGYLNYDPNRLAAVGIVDRMRKSMLHRGPDDHGLFADGPVAFGFNRLSIIDLSGGHQPLSNEDDTVWVVFNGEIYNFRELRAELIALGHRFRTQSDSETIVHGWEQWGEDVVTRLRGMFGFAIWDSRQQILFCARDRFGIKPFFYLAQRDRFSFASELKALLEVPGFEPQLNREAIGGYLRHRYVTGEQTMLAGIRRLRPAHALTVRSGRVTVRRYWSPPLGEIRRIREREAREELNALLDECMKLHLIADVPLGAFLSGGLDSSAVVAWMRRLGTPTVKTFSIGYDSEQSELPWAQIVADHFHTEHHPIVLTPKAFRDVLPRITWHMDEPVGDEASIPLYYLSEFARRDVTVALSGEGSDEIFGGYEIYRVMLALEKMNRIPGAGLLGTLARRALPPGRLKKYAGMLGRPLEQRYHGVSRSFSEDQASRLWRQPSVDEDVAAIYRATAGHPPLERMCHVDLQTWLAEDLLVKADRMSMANSLELRVPFLDHKLVEFACRLPLHLKLHGNGGKYLLKKCCEPLLPPAILNRKKTGFPVPTRSWFRNELAGYAREILTARDGIARELFDAQEIEDLLASHQMSDQSGPIYSLLVFDQWHNNFVKDRVGVLQ